MHTQENGNMTTKGELSRYVLAGATAFGADLSTLLIATQIFGLHYLGANIVGYTVGMALAYLLNTRWVFTEHRFSNKGTEFAVFNIILLIGLSISEATIYLFHHVMELQLALSKTASAVVVFAFNFILRKKIVFTAPEHTKSN